MHTHLRSFVVVLLLISSLASPAVVSADPGSDSARADRLIVQFAPRTKGSEMAELHMRAGATVVGMVPQLNTFVVDVSNGPKWLRYVQYKANRNVVLVEDDLVVQEVEASNDTYYVSGSQWGLPKVSAEDAWDITHSDAGIVVAVLDTGIDSTHPDLGSKIVAIENFSSDTSAEPGGNSHGTHVAGIAAACTNNAVGVAGLGYDASLMNVKVLSSSGTGSTSDLAQGIIWAVDHGADVINMSLGYYGISSTVHQAVDYAWDHDVVVVAAAGNDAITTPMYPAAFANCIAVAATTSTDALASFSNHGSWVDVAAPGYNIMSTKPGYWYGNMSGTSMASPFVAGLAALVLDVVTDTDVDGHVNDEAREAIQSSCNDTGIDVIYGRINAAAAVGTSPPPATGQVSGTVRDAATSTAIAGATVGDGTRTAVTDGEGAYLLSGVPAGTHTISTAGGGYIGDSREVTVVAGETTSADFSLEAEPVPNQAPVLDPIGDMTVDEDELLEFDVSAFDPDDDPLTWETSELPAGAEFAERVFSWRPADGQDGVYEITFTVSDGEDSDSETIHITVNAITRYGVIAGTVTDALTGEPLSAALVETGERETTTEPSGSYLFNDVPEGWHVVSVSADGYYGAEREVEVAPEETTTADFALDPMPNSPPVLEHIGKKTVDEDELLEFDVSAVDPDDDPLTWETSELPAGAEFAERVFRWRPADGQDGVYEITFTVSDGEDSDSETIHITVNDTAQYGAVTGIVIDLANRHAVAGVLVLAGEEQAVTDSNGLYGFEALPAGDYSLLFRVQGYVEQTESVMVVQGEATSVDVEIVPVMIHVATGEP